MATPRILLLLMLATGLLACQPPRTEESADLTQASDTAVDESSSNEIVLGHIDTIDSAVLEEERELWIYLPRSFTHDRENNPEAKYPVVYLLDGNGHFRSVAGMLYQLSTVNGNRVLPEMIMVGFPNTDRMRDLTPTHTDGTTGGGGAFLDFIETEAIPYIEANYPVTGYRTFIGHSLGGLMAIEALVERPALFTNYVAIDPSLWWDDQAILRKAEGALNEMNFTGKNLFVSVANTMRPGMTYDRVRQETGDETRHIRSILQFAEAAEADTRSGLNFAWRYYENDSHGSVPLISEYDALRQLFDWYDPSRQMLSYMIAETPDDAEGATEFIDRHWAMVSEQFGYTVVPPLRFIDQVAVSMRFNDKPESALAVARMNLSNYPASPVTHETMAEYFLWQGDEQAARSHFQHAIDRGAKIDIDARVAANAESDQEKSD